MKRRPLLCGLLCFLTVLSLTGCAAGPASSSEPPSEPEPVSEPLPVSYPAPTRLEITHPDFFADDDGAYRDAWLNAFAENTGITPTVGVPDGDYTEYLRTAAAQNALSGLVWVENQQQLLILKTAGVLEPLDGLLAANENLSRIPETFRNAFVYGDAAWALPCRALYRLPTVRSYHTALLSDAGVSAPTTAAGLLSLTEKLPDGCVTVFAAGTTDLNDIFTAFGAPLGENGLQYGYSATLGSVVDTALLPGAQDALTFLRALYERGGLNRDFLTAAPAAREAAVIGRKSASCLAEAGVARYLYAMRPLIKMPSGEAALQEAADTYTDVLTLGGGDDPLPQTITADVSGYCLIRGTEQGAEMINWLLNAVCDPDQWRLLYLGSEKNYASDAHGYVLSSDGKAPVPMPALTGPIDGLYDPEENLIYYPATAAMTRTALRQKALYRRQLLTEGFSDGRLSYLAPQYYGIESAVYAQNAEAVRDAFLTLIEDAVTDPDISVRAALNAYRDKMIRLGGDEILREANAAYGVSPVQYYGAVSPVPQPDEAASGEQEAAQ